MSFSSFVKDITGMSDTGTGRFVSSVIDPLDLTGKKGEWAAESAASAAAGGQQAQLDYLREIDRMPREYRDRALADLYDISSGTGEGQQQMIDRAKASPLYAEMMGSKGAGEEAVMRNAAMTGGLRSGNVQSALYENAARLDREALGAAYGEQMTGLKGLAQIPTYEQQIGQSMSDIGATTAMGITGAAQTAADTTNRNMNLGMGILSMFI